MRMRRILSLRWLSSFRLMSTSVPSLKNNRAPSAGSCKAFAWMASWITCLTSWTPASVPADGCSRSSLPAHSMPPATVGGFSSSSSSPTSTLTSSFSVFPGTTSVWSPATVSDVSSSSSSLTSSSSPTSSLTSSSLSICPGTTSLSSPATVSDVSSSSSPTSSSSSSFTAARPGSASVLPSAATIDGLSSSSVFLPSNTSR
ncbi:hypothetical protein Vretimale_17866 [Volvox reticuliferus]|uniref:Secreted protein n=1 Tax=Volvox reticuliferus TaxID=1737510 RepID=A0A8J4GW15_9CHLO|nr:hypothetical protein Vretifemale_1761 [Volvox reticuliferus]GIM15012.1 hypothetical protein Vretimale_17866 [Volvox reticuliferus]